MGSMPSSSPQLLLAAAIVMLSAKQPRSRECRRDHEARSALPT
jgi:hypothetical protein